MKTILLAAMTLLTVTANANPLWKNTAGAVLGVASEVQCSTGVTCTMTPYGALTMVASSPSFTLENAETLVNSTDDTVEVASDNAAIVFSLYSPLASDGDASLLLRADASADSGDDWQIVSDGATNDLLLQNDKSGSQATFYTFSEDGDVTIAGTTPHITVGDAGAEDHGILFDGHSGGVDFHIANDDSLDLLTIGVGLAAGTTPALTIAGGATVGISVGLTGGGVATQTGFVRAQVASTTTTITIAQCGSTFVSNSADVMTLFEASTALGCRITFVCGTADDFDINPFDGTDEIGIVSVDGAAIDPAAGDAIRCTDAGAGFTLEATGANFWAVVAHNGVITDVN